MNLPLNGRVVSAGITALTVMLAAFFLAQGTTSLLAASLFPVQAVARAATGGAALERPPGSEPPDGKAILARNIFDPQTGSLWPPKVAEAPPTEVGGEPPPEEIDPDVPPVPCEGSMRMVAAVHSTEMPEWSFATLTTGSDKPLLYRLGGKIEDKEVVAIFPKAVYMRQPNGRLCSVQMFFDRNAVAKAPVASRPALPVTPNVPATPAPSAATVTPGGMSEAELDQNIKALSETKYQIPRTFVDKILKNQAQIMSAARVVPHEENGRMLGVKLYGIRRNSLLGKLGLQNGDLLRTINGFEMSSPDSALEAYARLRNANNLTVAIVRRGQPTTLDYDVQ